MTQVSGHSRCDLTETGYVRSERGTWRGAESETPRHGTDYGDWLRLYVRTRT